ncbi:hypothetical protein BKA15_005582 [Microlunatus parietis]|uniref:Uncharacterized protein n=1 Tax=Microlunatus parietis TaxID=682979 RepID=A0A7Y9IC89_9ACTN|nr:hypothetical protein [Microlunatus parietis]
MRKRQAVQGQSRPGANQTGTGTPTTQLEAATVMTNHRGEPTSDDQQKEAWIQKQLAAAPEPSAALIASLNALRATPDGVGRGRTVAGRLPESA